MRPTRRVKREGGAADAAQLDIARDHGGLGTALPAVGTVVAAEVGEIDGLVDVRVAAAAAVLGVRSVLELGQREAVVLDAEVQRVAVAPEVGHERVVGVEDELGAVARDELGPAVGDRVELAVAVELVAEQVAEQHGPGGELGRDPVKPELVDLEQAELAVDPAAVVDGRE